MTAVAMGSPALVGETVADIVERLMAEFQDRLELDVISRVVLACRADLKGAGTAPLPELVARLARQRLQNTADRAGSGG